MHEMMPTPESALTSHAFKRLFTFMNQHVSFQLIRIGEFGRAKFAGVGSFACVYSEVSPQVCDLHELAVAMGALVGLLPSVEPHMRLEVVVSGEPLFAHSAAEWLLASVGPLVVLQDVFIPEGAMTRPAGEHFVSPGCRVSYAVAALHCF
jgi:hypothetical protein